MSITIKEMREQQSMTLDWGTTKVTRHFYAYDTADVYKGQIEVIKTAFMNELTAEGHLRIFGFGTTIPHYPGNSAYIIDSVNISQEGKEPKFLIEASYSMFNRSHGAFSQYNSLIPPWAMPWQINTSFSTIGHTPTHAYALSKWNGTGSQDINSIIPVLNSAGSAFDPPPEDDIFILNMVFRGARNPEAPFLTVQNTAHYMNTINGAPVLMAGVSFNPFYLKVKNLTTDTDEWNGILFQNVSAEIEYHPFSWFRTIPDTGPYYLDAVTGERRPFTVQNEEGEEESLEVDQDLNGFGQERGYNYGTDSVDPALYAAEGMTFIQYSFKTWTDFNELGLPKTAGGTF